MLRVIQIKMDSSCTQVYIFIICILCGIAYSTAQCPDGQDKDWSDGTNLPNGFTISSSKCPADKDKDWSYDTSLPNGPSHWGNTYPNCNGKSQSPLNIVTSQTENSGQRQILNVNGYDCPVGNVNISNDGHMITITIQDGVDRTITVDDKEYILNNFHFHWGNKTMRGSEDELNGNKYAMEVHLIHHEYSGSVRNTVVLSSFFSESTESNKAIDNILTVKEAYEYKGDYFNGEVPGKIDLWQLTTEGCRYYRYTGSRAYPPCEEGVIWLVCRTDKKIKTSQLDQLFSLYSVEKGSPDADQCHLLNIFRPVQDINGRKVYT